MAGLKKRLGEILLEMRVVTPADVQAGLEEQKVSGEKIGSVLVRRGVCRVADVLAALSSQMGHPSIDLTGVSPPHALQTLLESTYAEAKLVLPIGEEAALGRQKVYQIAMANPLDAETISEIEFKLQCKVKGMVALEGQLKDAIRSYYYAQDYGYDMSFQEDGSVRFAGGAPAEQPETVLGQQAPQPAAAPRPAAPPPPPPQTATRKPHPAATSLSGITEPPAASSGADAARIAQLEADVARLKSTLSALLRVLAERGVITREDIQTHMQRS